MIELADAIPRETVLARYPEAHEIMITGSVKALREKQPDRVPAVGLFVWDEMAA